MNNASHQPGEFSLRRGILTINGALIAFVVGDVIIKLLGQSFSTNELLFFRSLIIIVTVGILMLARKERLHLKRLLSPVMLARCLFDCLNILAFTTAVVRMGLGELYAILLMAPLLMTIIAAVFFREPVGIRRWLAICVGFVGVLFVVKPSTEALDVWAFVGFGAAVAAAARETITQKIDPATPTTEVAFYSAVVVGLATSVIGYWEAWVVPSPQQSLMILAQACTWLAGAALLIQACRYVPLFLVASFRYTTLVWGGLAGYFVFGDVPDIWSLIGSVLIVGAGLYALHREAVRRRALASKVIPMS